MTFAFIVVLWLNFSFSENQDSQLIQKSLETFLSPHKIGRFQLLRRVRDGVYVKVRTEKYCYKLFLEKVSKLKPEQSSYYRLREEIPVEMCGD